MTNQEAQDIHIKLLQEHFEEQRKAGNLIEGVDYDVVIEIFRKSDFTDPNNMKHFQKEVDDYIKSVRKKKTLWAKMKGVFYWCLAIYNWWTQIVYLIFMIIYLIKISLKSRDREYITKECTDFFKFMTVNKYDWIVNIVITIIISFSHDIIFFYDTIPLLSLE